VSLIPGDEEDKMCSVSLSFGLPVSIFKGDGWDKNMFEFFLGKNYGYKILLRKNI